MSRLLFAAARGARLQYQSRNSYCWMPCDHIPTAHFFYRIHPEDEHLQYGPISTALHEEARVGGSYKSLSIETSVAHAYADYASAWPWWRQSVGLHRSLFLLILSEALADEGL